MIEGIEINIYFEDSNNISFDLTSTQTETVFKALGLQVDTNAKEIQAFSDNSLRKHILPKVNFKPVKKNDDKS